MIKLILYVSIFINIQYTVSVDRFIINQGNCFKNAIITKKCHFQIDIKNPSESPLACFIKFANPNNSILLNVHQEFLVKSQIGTKCPDFKLILHTPIKDEKIEMTCGGTVPVIEKVISNVSLVRFLYDNQKIDNDDTKINITLTNRFVDIKSCKDDNGDPGNPLLPLLIGVVFGIVILIIIIVIVVLIMFKKNQKKRRSDKPKKEKGPIPLNTTDTNENEVLLAEAETNNDKIQPQNAETNEDDILIKTTKKNKDNKPLENKDIEANKNSVA